MSIYAVNGKEPIAAWIPSLDTAGNGTTTLTDLVGSNDGTLTNMDAATDWVADTDAGGVRALDFDGVNDYISLPSGGWGALAANTAITASVWVKTTSSSRQAILADWNASGIGDSFIIQINTGQFQAFARNPFFSSGSMGAATIGTWMHMAASASSSGFAAYINGSLVASNATVFTPANGTQKAIARGGAFNALYFSGKLDDIRIFDEALDATDIAYLYNSGNGRGIVATTPNTRRRRYAGGYGL